MSEYKDPSIRLFGKTIQLGSSFNDDTIVSSRIEPCNSAKNDVDFDCESTSDDQKFPCSKLNENRVNEEPTSQEPMEAEQGERSSESALEEPKTPTSRSTEDENIKTPTKDMSQDLSKSEHDHIDQASSNSESSDQNTLKKPDKIIPCARCNSMDTKFCYFNNYNVNQPRHFCKNCQRYWTAGGSMRNVPVGAGRRKSKSSLASHPHQLVIPGASYGLIHHVMRPDGTVFAIGVDDSLCNQSKVPMMKLGEGLQSFLPNEVLKSEQERKGSNCTSISVEKNEDCKGGINSSQVVPYFSYGWNPIPQQTTFPLSFHSGSNPQLGENSASPWNLNWVPTPLVNSHQSSTNSSPNNSPLGKHSRECLTLMPSISDNKDSGKKELENSRVVIPKTLRIDDPSEAAKSSIWTTLGIKHDHIGSSSGRVAFFGGLQHAKGVPYERRNINQNIETSSMVLQANPAAFSRSLSFHEIAQ